MMALSCLALPAQAEFFTLRGHGGPIKGLDVSPDGKSILTASFDYSLGLWRDGRPRWLEAHRAAANAVRFVGNDRAVSSGDDFTMLLWDLTTGKPTPLGRHKGKVLSLAVAPDTSMVASASWDGTIGLWPLDDAAPRFLTGHSAGVNDAVFTSDGTSLYSASADGTVRLWDVASGQEKMRVVKNGFGVNTLVLNDADGWLAYGAVDGVTHVIDTKTGSVMADFTLDHRPILAMATNRDFTRLAVGDGEGYIMLVDTGTWKIVADFHATRRGPVWALRFSADGRNIHAGGLDDVMFSFPLDGFGDGPLMTQQDRPFLRGAQTGSNGERQFKRKCSICHSLTPDSQHRAGPTLYNVFGRRAGTLPGYRYSAALARAGIAWTDDTIDKLFELGPDHFTPGSKMPMQRIVAAQDRRDLIDFLHQFSDTKN